MYENPPFLAEDLYKVNQAINEKLVNAEDKYYDLWCIDSFTKSCYKKAIPENESPDKIIDTVEKIW